MPVTKDQADMLAALATACRPTGAPRWDAPGVVAAIGKVKHLSLADVTLAVIRAADDRDARTPGVIANTRSACWQERAGDRPRELDVLAPNERCGVCGQGESRCRRNPHADHAFEPDLKRPTNLDVPTTVGALRELVIDAKAEPAAAGSTATRRNDTARNPDTHAETEGASA